jgi:hypothetical protein
MMTGGRRRCTPVLLLAEDDAIQVLEALAQLVG